MNNAGVVDLNSALQVTLQNTTRIKPQDVRAFKRKAYSLASIAARKTADSLAAIGLGGNAKAMNDVMASRLAFVGDAAPAGYAEMNPLQQFYTVFVPGIQIGVQAPLKAEELFGMNIVGDITTEWIARRLVDLAGNAGNFRDTITGDLSLYRGGFEYIQTAALQATTSTTYMKSQMQGAAGFDYEMLCDKAAALALAQAREAIYWRGLSGKLTYGLLNSPNMPAITSVAATGTGSSTLWVNKTYLQILDDVRTKLMAVITSNTYTGFDVYKDACLLLLPPDAFNYISTMNVQGTISVKDQLLSVYKGMTIEAAPYLKDAVSGTDDVMMLVASQAVDYDESTDDMAVVSPVVNVIDYLLAAIPNQNGGITKSTVTKVAGTLIKRPTLVAWAYGV